MYTYHPADGGSLWSKHTSYAGSYNFSFYSDVTLLSASACRINNVDYAVAQLPYIGIVTAISFVGYIVCGFVMV